MTRKEVEDVGACQEEPVVPVDAPGIIEVTMQLVHRPRCVEGGDGGEADGDRAVGALFGDEVVRGLPAPAWLWRELIEVAVELEDDVRGERDVLGA